MVWVCIHPNKVIYALLAEFSNNHKVDATAHLMPDSPEKARLGIQDFNNGLDLTLQLIMTHSFFHGPFVVGQFPPTHEQLPLTAHLALIADVDRISCTVAALEP